MDSNNSFDLPILLSSLDGRLSCYSVFCILGILMSLLIEALNHQLHCSSFSVKLKKLLINSDLARLLFFAIPYALPQRVFSCSITDI